MPVSSVQFGQTPWQYVNGLRIKYNATTSLKVETGSILDSTGVYQMDLDTETTVDATASGLNGLDSGSLAASTVYAVFVVGDPVTQQATGCMISTSYTAPLMPFGYSAFALVGYIATDASSHFLLGYWTGGNSAQRLFMYDAPQATAVTAGAATTFTAVTLNSWVPIVDKTPVWIYSQLTPGAASRQLFLQPQVGTGSPIIVTGQVTSVVVSSNSYLFSSKNSTNQQINYKVTNAGDAAALSVAGYNFYV